MRTTKVANTYTARTHQEGTIMAKVTHTHALRAHTGRRVALEVGGDHDSGHAHTHTLHVHTPGGGLHLKLPGTMAAPLPPDPFAAHW